MPLSQAPLTRQPGHNANRESHPMSNFPWKTTLAGAAILAATVYAYAQMSPGMHGQTPQGGMHQGMHGGGMDQHQHNRMHGGQAGLPTMPGQDAFGAIQEVVR